MIRDEITGQWKPTLEDQINCVRRELRLRERVYGRMVKDGRMKQDQASRDYALMYAVLMTLRSLEAQSADASLL